MSVVLQFPRSNTQGPEDGARQAFLAFNRIHQELTNLSKMVLVAELDPNERIAVISAMIETQKSFVKANAAYIRGAFSDHVLKP